MNRWVHPVVNGNDVNRLQLQVYTMHIFVANCLFSSSIAYFENGLQPTRYYCLHIPYQNMTKTSRKLAKLSDRRSQSPSWRADRLLRYRRSTVNVYIDVVAVVDYSVYLRHLRFNNDHVENTLRDIREYYAFVFDGVNRRYADTNFDSARIKIQVNLINVIIWQTSADSVLYTLASTRSLNEVDATTASDLFASYIASTAGKTALGSHDYASLFTTYRLAQGWGWSRRTNVEGVSYDGEMCGNAGRSSSVVKDVWGVQATRVTAHELAHSLGAYHDGDGNRCRGDDMFIMQAGGHGNTDKQTNAWMFSECSKTDISSWIRIGIQTSRHVRECLTNSMHVSADIPDVSDRLIGQEVSADQQCQRQYGNYSQICWSIQSWSPLSEICKCMFCKLNTTSCIRGQAARGTSCGEHKLCLQGKCVDDNRALSLKQSSERNNSLLVVPWDTPGESDDVTHVSADGGPDLGLHSRPDPAGSSEELSAHDRSNPTDDSIGPGHSTSVVVTVVVIIVATSVLCGLGVCVCWRQKRQFCGAKCCNWRQRKAHIGQNV